MNDLRGKTVEQLLFQSVETPHVEVLHRVDDNEIRTLGPLQPCDEIGHRQPRHDLEFPCDILHPEPLDPFLEREVCTLLQTHVIDTPIVTEFLA